MVCFVPLRPNPKLQEIMRKFIPKLLACLCLMAVSGIVRAERLDEEQARQAAVSFFNNSTDRGLRRVKAQQLRLLPAKRQSGCYIFDREDGGTVFVADDDAIGYTVLGYTDGGSFNPDSIPVGLQDWLDQIGVLMDAVHEGKLNQRHKLETRAGSVEVEPLIKTKWNQTKPYNNLTPTINGQHCLTGCVATAIAQVLKYWRWPEYSHGNGGYYLNSDYDKEYTVAIGTKYNWDNMLNTYSEGSYTQQQAQAVAELMRDCGYAVYMNYGVNESAAGVAPEWLSTVFDYRCVAGLLHDDFTEEAWHVLIRKDLTEGRPILYSGQGSAGGHEYVIDGYRSDNYLHVNWGWGGYADGWFVTTDMQGYNSGQYMIHGFEPSNRDASPFSYTLKDGVLTIIGEGVMSVAYNMEHAPWRERCKEIKKIVIGEGITSVVDDFGYCWTDGAPYYFSNLEELSLPEGLTFLGRNAFYDASIEHVELPSSLMLLNDAFWDCSKLKVLHLGPNVIDFEDAGLSSETRVEVDKANPYIMIRDNVVYTKDGTWLKALLVPSHELVIPEDVKVVSSRSICDLSLVISKPHRAPQVKGSDRLDYLQGMLIVPKGASGYANWTKELYPNHKILYCSDIDKATPNLDWSLQDGVLRLKGLSVIDESDSMPYSSVRDKVKKIEVGEGIVFLDWGAFWDCYNAEDITLPSTLQAVRSYAFPYYVNSITCSATKAPILMDKSLRVYTENGTLRIPVGATGYDAWFKDLPSGWKLEYYTPAPQVAYKLPGDDAEHGACSLDAWEAVLKDYPNTVGVFKGDFDLLPYLTYNVAVADASAQSGYLCYEFRMTDLTSGYKTTDKAPKTGFNPIVPFDVLEGSYKRQLYAGNNSVCLPFEVAADDMPQYCSLYTYSHYDSENEDAIFTSAQMVDAAQPCYIVAQYDKTWTMTLDGYTISNQQPSATGNFCGTYVSTSQFKDRGYAPRNSDNIFAPLADQLHPFRACFILDAPANVRMQLLDGEETAISSVRTQRDDVIYRMDGVRVSGKGQRGIYIVNGKKVIK